MPDYEYALLDEEGRGTWTGNLSTGRRSWRCPGVLFNENGAPARRDPVCRFLTATDRQVFMIVTVLLAAGADHQCCLSCFRALFYSFDRQADPGDQCDRPAEIAQGDFDALSGKASADDEVGQLWIPSTTWPWSWTRRSG